MATQTAPINQATTMILSQFDQKTQLQALEMLRQLNAQQQMQHYQQLQHLQQLQLQQNQATPLTLQQQAILQQQQLQQQQHHQQQQHQASVQAQIHARAQAAAAQAKQEQAIKQAPKFATGPDGEKFQIPDEELTSQIVQAAEHYFSDDNLIKDHYLLRQICQKSEGFLSLKLLTALKTIKRITKDWRVTSYALEHSSKALKLNAEKTKVKRVAALPDHVLNARQITSVIAIKIPLEFSSVRQITQMFAEFGKISLVRVLMPGRQVPCDLRNYATQVPDMGSSLCAIVEYETEQEACFACRELNNKKYESGMRSALLGPRLRRNLYKSPTENVETAEQIKQGMKMMSVSGNVVAHSSSSGNSSNEDKECDKKSEKDSCNSSTSSVTNNPLKQDNKGWMKVGGVNGRKGKADSGCDTASSHSGGSNRRNSNKFDRAPGAGRKSVKMTINISSSQVSPIVRQPRGPIASQGFALSRTVKA
jgi:hypothetical protein